jgi:hypothetical protein
MRKTTGKITKAMLHEELERVYGAHSVTMQKLDYEDLYEETKVSSTWYVTVRLRKPRMRFVADDKSRNAARRAIYDALQLVQPNLPCCGTPDKSQRS